MIVLDLNGNEIKWNFSKYFSRKLREGKSSGHMLTRSILMELFPNSALYEEVTLPTSPATYADFFIPDSRLFVEVNGKQHYEYNPFFYKDKLEFYKSQSRDRMKKEWCRINNFTIIELPYNETESWKQTIANSISR